MHNYCFLVKVARNEAWACGGPVVSLNVQPNIYSSWSFRMLYSLRTCWMLQLTV